MRKCATVLLVAALAVMIQSNAFAERVSLITFNCAAVVTGVVDGGALKVKVVETGEIGLVKLIGVDAGNNADAVAYLTDKTLGQIVSLKTDAGIKAASGIWSVLHVLRDGADMSERLLAKGYATVNAKHSKAYNYSQLLYEESYAKGKKFGLWFDGGGDATASRGDLPAAYEGPRLNLNTASESTMSAFFGSALSPTAIRAIVTYRAQNPFNNVKELKFVSGITKTFFDEWRDKLSVSTNVRTAGKEELACLVGLNSTDVDKIIAYRDANTIADPSELEDVVGTVKYRDNKAFVACSDVSAIVVSIPDKRADLNKATAAELAEIGLTAAVAANIVGARSGYTFKTPGELVNAGVGVTSTLVDQLDDNLTLPEYQARVNINTATFEQLQAILLDYETAEKVFAGRGRWTSWKSLTVDLTAADAMITLYTNINTAGAAELKTLGISADLAAKIVDYRDDQPFGSAAEVQTFFTDNGASNIYASVRLFITVR